MVPGAGVGRCGTKQNNCLSPQMLRSRSGVGGQRWEWLGLVRMVKDGSEAWWNCHMTRETDYYGVWYKGKGKRECPSVKQMMKN